MKGQIEEYLDAVADLIGNLEFEGALSKINKIDRLGELNLNQSGSLSALIWYCGYCLDDTIEADSISEETSAETRSDFLDGFGTQLANIDAIHLAEPVFKQLVAVAPEYASAWHKLGLTFLLQNRPEEAIDAFRKAIALDNSFPSSHFLLGESYSKIGKPEDAATSYAACVELEPEDLDALILCGIENSKAESNETAIAMFERAIQVDPSSASAYFNLAIMAFSNGDIDLLRDIQAQFAKNAEPDARSDLIDAHAHELNGNLEDAWESIKSAFSRSIEAEHWDTLDGTTSVALTYCQRNNVLGRFDGLIDEIFAHQSFPENVLQYLRESRGRKLRKGKCFNVLVEGEIEFENLEYSGGKVERKGYIWGANVIASSDEQAGKLALEFDRRCGRRPHSISSVEPIENGWDDNDVHEGVYWCQEAIHTFPLI